MSLAALTIRARGEEALVNGTRVRALPALAQDEAELGRVDAQRSGWTLSYPVGDANARRGDAVQWRGKRYTVGAVTTTRNLQQVRLVDAG